MDGALGTVERIWVYPVKSLAGTSVPRVGVDPDGLAGDRAYAVVDAATGAVLRAKDAPGIAAVVPTGDPDADARALTAVVGTPVRLAPRSAGRADGTAAVHLVSRQALQRAAAGEVPAGCAAEDPRANLVLDLPDDDERSWVGRRLRIGTAEVEVTRLPKHCLGVYAEVVSPGTLATGDPVTAAGTAAGTACG